jgi:pyruvate, water dikinase
MAIRGPAQAEEMTNAFFQGEYDFLNQNAGNRLPGFYTPSGDWSSLEGEEEDTILIQDGSHWLTSIGTGFAGFMGKVAGEKYQEFLDNVGAYYHFPLAISKESGRGDGVLSVQVQPLGGRIDQAGGLAFGLRNVGNYFVLRVNALENNLILFEFINNRRYTRASSSVEIEKGRWHTLQVEVSGNQIKGCLDGNLLMDYTADWPVHGHIGLWTKADSLTRFRNLTGNGVSATRSWSETKPPG